MRTSTLIRKLKAFFSTPDKWTRFIRKEQNKNSYCVLGAIGQIMAGNPNFDDEKLNLKVAKALRLDLEPYKDMLYGYGHALANWNNGCSTFDEFMGRIKETSKRMH